MMTLTAKEALGIQPGQKLGDGCGLRLVCDKRTGSKYFELRVQHKGKQHTLGCGPCHGTTLKDVKQELDAARSTAAKLRQQVKSGRMDTFEEPDGLTPRSTLAEVYEAFIKTKEREWSNAKHAQQWRNSVKQHMQPVLKVAVEDLTPKMMVDALRPVWISAPETGKRIAQRLNLAMAYAEVMELRIGNPLSPAVVKASLPKQSSFTQVQHHTALPYSTAPDLYTLLDKGDGISHQCLKWLLLTATRSSEARGARWSEIDLDNMRWVIPAGRMKARRPHSIPITQPMLPILEWAKTWRLAHGTDYIFCGPQRRTNISDVALNKVLKHNAGGQYVVHGLRSTFRDWGAECHGHTPDRVLEQALAHGDPDKTRAAYLRAELWQQRSELMTAWAAYLTTKKDPHATNKG